MLNQRQKQKTEVSLNSSNKPIISPSTLKPVTIDNALVPYNDSEKDDDNGKGKYNIFLIYNSIYIIIYLVFSH